MRLKPGEKISLFNSTNGEWDASILTHGKGLTEFKVEKLSRPQKEESNLWLAFSPIKKIPQDMMIQKTTELGVQKFIPILCERSVVREINIERAEKIVTEASEQSNRISVPQILKIKTLENFLKNFPENGNIIFCDINFWYSYNRIKFNLSIRYELRGCGAMALHKIAYLRFVCRH